MPLDAENVLVTGASGFIGAHLCKRLLREGVRVIGTTRNRPQDLPPEVTPAVLDLGDAQAVEALIKKEKPEVVFHLASCVKGGRGMELVIPTFEANLSSTVTLMQSAAQSGCQRFVLTGSLEEPQQAGEPPSSPYAAAKAAATAYARMFHALYAFPSVIARVFMVYGPDQKDRRKLVPYVTDCLLNHQSPVLSSGTRPVDWIYVEDVVEGLLLMASADGVEGKTIDLGTGRLETVRTVVETLAAIVGSKVPLPFDPAADRPHEQVRGADIHATEAALEWTPAVTLEEGLQRTVEWHRCHPLPA